MVQHWKKDWYDQIPSQSSKCKPVTYPSQAHPFPPLFCQHPSLFLLVFHSRSSLFLQELRPVDWRLSRSGSPWRRSLCRRWTRLHPARLMSLALMLWAFIGFNATKDKTCCQKVLKKNPFFLTQSYKYLATSSNSEDPTPWVDLSSSPSLFFHVFSHLLFRISISII